MSSFTQRPKTTEDSNLHVLIIELLSSSDLKLKQPINFLTFKVNKLGNPHYLWAY